MSNADSKSSSGSETNSSAKAREDSLDRMIVDQQQHLISHYQYKKSKTISGEVGKCRAF